MTPIKPIPTVLIDDVTKPIVVSPDVAALIAAQAKEITAAANLYVRMPKLRSALGVSIEQLLERLEKTCRTFFKEWNEEYGPEK